MSWGPLPGPLPLPLWAPGPEGSTPEGEKVLFFWPTQPPPSDLSSISAVLPLGHAEAF